MQTTFIIQLICLLVWGFGFLFISLDEKLKNIYALIGVIAFFGLSLSNYFLLSDEESFGFLISFLYLLFL